MRYPANAYRQFSVQGSTPLGLVVMLYDGAITAMRRATTAIENNDIAQKCTHLNKAQAIILQLEGTLNFEQGGEVAQTLKALYVHARAQILKANIENSPEILRTLIDRLATVREAWNEADRRTLTAPPAAAAAEAPQEARVEAEPRHKAEFKREAEPQHAAEPQIQPPPPPPPTPARRKSPYAFSPSGEPGSLRFSG